VSIPSNIAEGSKRGMRKDYANFIGIALGSSAELQTQLIIANRQGYITESIFNNMNSLLEEVMKMLNSLKKKLKQ